MAKFLLNGGQHGEAVTDRSQAILKKFPMGYEIMTGPGRASVRTKRRPKKPSMYKQYSMQLGFNYQLSLLKG